MASNLETPLHKLLHHAASDEGVKLRKLKQIHPTYIALYIHMKSNTYKINLFELSELNSLIRKHTIQSIPAHEKDGSKQHAIKMTKQHVNYTIPTLWQIYVSQ